MSRIFKKYITTKIKTTKIMESPIGVKLDISLVSKSIDTINPSHPGSSVGPRFTISIS